MRELCKQYDRSKTVAQKVLDGELEPKYGGGRERTFKIEHVEYLCSYVLQNPLETLAHYGAALFANFPPFLTTMGSDLGLD